MYVLGALLLLLAATIISYNRGQHGNQSLQPFKNRERPDIIALQEAANRARSAGAVTAR